MTEAVVVRLFDSVAEAPIYDRSTVPLTLNEAVVVREGMNSGNASVDLCLTGLDGTKYVTMVTGEILDSVAHVVRSVAVEEK